MLHKDLFKTAKLEGCFYGWKRLIIFQANRDGIKRLLQNEILKGYF